MLKNSINQSDINNSLILVVDDNPANLKVISGFLKSEGYHNIIESTQPLEALHLLTDRKPDLLITDMMMPEMNGAELIFEVKDNPETSWIPCIVVTADHSAQTLQDAFDAGASDFLTKPITDRTILLVRVRNFLIHSLLFKNVIADKDCLQGEVLKKTQELNLKNLELAGTTIEIIYRLSKAAEYRDNETGEHILRMSKYSAILAKTLGYDSKFVDNILHASPMHDVGKIGISDAILFKPGKLTNEEFDIMKTHTTLGKEILDKSDKKLLQIGAVIAETHHEKWNGRGYPYGLKGLEIPDESRIVAVADVFDALTMKRPYKEPWPVEKALELIKSESGEHFEPVVVEAFFKSIEEILKVKGEHSE